MITPAQSPAPKRSATHVWYASYGSNLFAKRFECYLQGGKVDGMADSCVGARNPTPPTQSAVARVPHALFFGQESTRRWGTGGVAFLDPIRCPNGSQSVVRMYRITLDQFNDVVAQENRTVPPLPAPLQLTPKGVEALRRAPHQSVQLLPEGLYAQLKLLGERQGEPILTFTCPLAHREEYRRGLRTPFVQRPPSAAYYGMLHRGLLECALTHTEAADYLQRAATTPVQGAYNLRVTQPTAAASAA